MFHQSSRKNPVTMDSAAEEYFQTLPKLMQENIIQSGLKNCSKTELEQYARVNEPKKK